MTFEINANAPLQAEIIRLMTAELDNITTQLSATEDRELGIHEARKSIKKLRSILRLVRTNLKPKFYQREDTRYRDTARMLASARDHFVIYETLDLLRPHLEDRSVLNTLRRHYSRIYRQEQADLLDDAETLAVAQETIDDAIRRLQKLKLSREGIDAIAPNLCQTYQEGLSAYLRAGKKGKVQDFHEWRKHVKYLWHQVRLLSPIWNPTLGTLASELKVLSDLLGVAHDLTIMDEAIMATQDDHDITPLLAVSALERQRLEGEALNLGALIYAESPETFVERIATYWLIHTATHATDENAIDG